MSANTNLLDEWAEASGTVFVSRSHGLQTTATVSRDDLMQLVNVAVELEQKRWIDAIEELFKAAKQNNRPGAGLLALLRHRVTQITTAEDMLRALED